MMGTFASHSRSLLVHGAEADDDLRRVPRLSVCCRVEVRGRRGVWTAVTEDVGARGCRIVTPSFPRLGSRLEMSLSSDLFPLTLDVVAETVWATSSHLGVLFVETVAREGALTPAAWLEQVVAHGRVPGAPHAPARVVPALARRGSRDRPASSPEAAPLRRASSSIPVPGRARASPSP